ncbi:hypothetical protein DPMN_178488 [Dreissena polymorpha]|uniref:Uncharacterized protein n=2 Tax=Dreissena polymorpha TaxID=45954 RepID=A0A9D4IIQ5_DREPO|nr:hypothetical protein DPMN_178488 [Dreissena polymorpha]
MRGLFTVDPQKGVSIIDSVCSVIKAQDARLTPTQGYLFQSIMSLFGKDMEHNICSLITFADGLDPPVKNAMDMSKLPFGEWFTFNNSALFAKNTTLDSSSMSQIFWEMGLQSFRNFFQHLGKLPPTSLKLTSEVLKERHELEAIVRNLSPLLDAGLVQINTLNAQIKCCEENKSIIADNKDFTFTVNKNKKLKKDLPVGEHVIKCLNCHFTCYEKFYISNDDEKRYCLLFDQKSGYCKRCPNKCFRNEHVIFPYIYEYVVVKEQQTFYDMKKIYEEASSKLLNQEQLIADIKADLNKVVENVYEMMETFNESKARLNEISLRPNPLTIKEHINLLIESEKMEKKNGWLDRLKSLQVFRKRADIDSEVNNFLSQATLHVTAEKKTERKKKKQK